MMPHWKDFLDPAGPPGDYLPWTVVRRRTSLSRTTAWRLQKRGDFPAPYAISPGRVGYREDEVEAWRASRRPHAGRKAEPLPSTAEPSARFAPREPSKSRPSTGPVAGAEASASVTAPAKEPSRAAIAEVSSARGDRLKRRRSEHAKAIAQQITFDF